MIDTIKLVLDKNMFTILDPNLFERDLMNSGRGYFTMVQNPTKSELKRGIYKPRLTYTHRFNCSGRSEKTLAIEFSAQKLIYKNNFDELEDSDFDLVVSTLHQKLKEMSVLIFSPLLIKAPVSLIHYSKNIELHNGLIPYTLLKEIRKANITQRLDFNQCDFRNEGHCAKFRTNSFEIVFYDKIKDLEKARISEKRAIERDNVIQMGLFDKLQEDRGQKRLEVLRMEVRLNQRRKIRQILKEVGTETELTFQSLFKKEISQKVLLYYLNMCEESYPKTLYFKPKSISDFLSQFLIDNPKARPKDALSALGFHEALEEVSTRELRELLGRQSNRSWYRLIEKMEGYDYAVNKVSPFKIIRLALEEFKPLRLVDF